jgi:hypothetical protein
MKPSCQPLKTSLKAASAVALLASVLVSPLPVHAQASAPPETAPSSVAPAGRTGPRLLSPSEMRDRTTQPGDIRPERPVERQINIPIGRKPPPQPKTEARAIEARNARRTPAASAAGVDDAAARCEAEVDDAVRSICRDKRAKMGKKAAPI